MNYIDANKAAWEEAFKNRNKNWGADIIQRIQTADHPFLQKDVIAVLEQYDLKDKTIAQFCCNNGRELFSVMKYGAKEGYGFDIAENQVKFANDTAKILGINCSFIATDILKIGKEYNGKFDMIIITIGALCWFKDLKLFFDKVSQCLTKNGCLIINEQHPVTNMLGAPGEDNYVESNCTNIVNSYFEKEWFENDGMYYMTQKQYKSKTFVNYSHSFSAILNSICESGMQIQCMQEFDYDISGMFDQLNQRGIPLSYILEAKKV